MSSLTKDVSSNPHDVVENAGELTKQNSDIFGSQRDVNVQEFLHGQTEENEGNS